VVKRVATSVSSALGTRSLWCVRFAGENLLPSAFVAISPLTSFYDGN
jgi:hypothetical protein